MTVQDVSSAVQAASAVAIVLFSVLGYVTAKRALAESHRQADVAADALAETRRQAELAQAAVEAANASVVEARRQTQLARVPFVPMGRPTLATDGHGRSLLEVPVQNLGSEPALELRLSIDRQDSENGDWFRDLKGTPMLPLLGPGDEVGLRYDAADLRNTDADWTESIGMMAAGRKPTTPPLVSHRLRVSLTYLSLLNVRVSQVHIWETKGDVIHLVQDPWTWRLETLTFDPGADNGAAIVVRRPD
jgi:hypothetical protein